MEEEIVVPEEKEQQSSYLGAGEVAERREYLEEQGLCGRGAWGAWPPGSCQPPGWLGKP
jgi:hypothetical protein